ncbi:arylsulfatase [Reichenbachiella sp. MALMAid0571]|uniref:arylsulfatase n=1 Tax=Reichenbachiella sp. MALMAid0571 TaxID=3143939 RepID=UPI0032DF91F1
MKALKNYPLSMNKLLYALAICIMFQQCALKERIEEKKAKPNIIYILADDLGYGDLGCYGQQKIKTPNIDNLAKSGIRFTQHYSGSTVCAPSRSSLMTGLHTGHTHVRGNRGMEPEGQFPLKDEAFTLAELLKTAGYKTGAFGKWGLGFVGTEGDPNNQGFDEFYGYNCQSRAHRYYPTHLWHNSDKIIMNGNDGMHTVTYAQDLIHSQALKFIDENKDKPFFLFMPYVLPHAELIAPDDEILKQYKGVFPEQYYEGVKGSAYDSGWHYARYMTQETPHAVFAAMVSRIDKYVGDVMLKLEELSLDKNTLVIFTSDNGPHIEGGADPDFFDSNGPLRGVKRDLYEGGIRVPMIAQWTGKIAAGKTSDHISSFWDVMPTLAELADVEIPEKTDGVSFLPTLLSQDGQQQHKYLYWEFHEWGGKQAVRKGNWKAIRLNVFDNPDGSIQLYNLDIDIGEENDIAGDNTQVVAEMAEIMTEAHIHNNDFPFFNPDK